MKEKQHQLNRLQHERISLGWSQEDVAEKLGVNVRTVRRWESGHPVRPYNISGLTKLFGKSAEALGLIEEIPPSPDPSAPETMRTTYFHFFPIPIVPLIGRKRELLTIKQLLSRDEVRLLTLTGPGGTGKTRLGVQVAIDLREIFADGVFFIDLAPIRDPSLVAGSLARALGIQEDSGSTLLEKLKAHLHPRQSLLLLDNFEQVIEAASQLVELIVACHRIKLLITSREILHVQGEYEHIIPPLELPDRTHATHMADLVALSDNPSVKLFMQRAQARRSEFQLTAQNSAAIAEICIRLEGLPLAIELAAARSKFLQPQALLRQLGGRLDVGEAKRDAPKRQQTMRNSIAWSYDLLSLEERRLFQRLSIFVSGCTLHAAEAICILPDEETSSLLDGVASLIDKSLLLPLKQVKDEEPRIVMLETIREYGRECLEKSGELEIIQQRHAHYYLVFAEATEAELTGTNEKSLLERLELERQNMRVALNWALTHRSEEVEIALRLCNALWHFWRVYGYLSEGRRFLEQTLRSSQTSVSSLRAKALNAAGILAGLQGSYEQAEMLCRESMAMFRELGDKQGIAVSLNFLGQIATWKSNYAYAHESGEEALTIFRELGDKLGIIATLITLATASFNKGDYARTSAFAEECLIFSRELQNSEGIARSLWLLGVGSFSQGDFIKAQALLMESLALSEELDDKRGIADAKVILAYVASFQSRFDEMRSLLEKAMELHKALGDQRGIALGLYGQAWLALAEKRYGTAHTAFKESLTILVGLGHQWFAILCIEGLAWIASIQGALVQAGCLWGAADALRKSIGAVMPPILSLMYERVMAKARAQLGEESFATAWAEGQMMTLAQILEIWS